MHTYTYYTFHLILQTIKYDCSHPICGVQWAFHRRIPVADGVPFLWHSSPTHPGPFHCAVWPPSLASASCCHPPPFPNHSHLPTTTHTHTPHAHIHNTYIHTQHSFTTHTDIHNTHIHKTRAHTRHTHTCIQCTHAHAINAQTHIPHT